MSNRPKGFRVSGALNLPLTRPLSDLSHKGRGILAPQGVIPAKAGTQEMSVILQAFSWVPDSRFALSGMTPVGLWERSLKEWVRGFHV